LTFESSFTCITVTCFQGRPSHKENEARCFTEI